MKILLGPNPAPDLLDYLGKCEVCSKQVNTLVRDLFEVVEFGKQYIDILLAGH